MKKNNFIALFGIIFIFMLPMAMYGPHDQEEWGFSTWATLTYVQSIWGGSFPSMWTDALGLGSPLPIGHRFDFSPPFFLFPFLGIRWVVTSFYFFYALLAIVYLWLLCAKFNINSTFAKLVVCTTFLLSPPTVQLTYLDDWPTLFHNWCFVPVIFYYILKIFTDENKQDFYTTVLLLGFVGGVWLVNGHPGHLYTLTMILFIPTFYLLIRTKKKCLIGILISAAIALLISIEHTYYSISEILNYPSSIKRLTQGELSFDHFKGMLFLPFNYLPINSMWSGNFFNYFKTNDALVHNLNYRNSFIGGIFLVTAFIAALRYILFKISEPKNIGLILTSIGVAFISSFILMFSKPEWLRNLPSGMWMFRDGTVFFGILLCGCIINSILTTKFRKLRILIYFLVAINFAQLLISNIPAFLRATQISPLNNYKNFGKSAGLPGWLKDSTNKNNRLFILSDVASIRTEFAADGLYGVTDLTFMGVNPFTFWIKSVSMDDIYQSTWLGHGYLSGNREVLQNREMFDIYGITHLLLTQKDFDAIDKKNLNGMNLISDFPANSGRLFLLENSTVWPKAFLMNNAFLKNVNKNRKCKIYGGVCNDYSDWSGFRLNDNIEISGANGLYDVKLEPKSEERIFVATKLYRSEWIAYANQSKLEVFKTDGGLLGVKVPKNIDSFQLKYNPYSRKLLLAISISTFFLTILLIVFLCVKKYRVRYSQ